MRKLMIVVSAAILLAAISLSLLLAYPRFKSVERRGGGAPTSGSVEASESAVAQAINKIFRADRSSLPEPFSNFSLATTWDQIFPDDFQMRATSDSSLRAYLSIDPRTRQNDLFLYEPTGNYYWHSEYYHGGEPARFRCGFIIHLRAEQASLTSIEIFEYQPRVWAGKKFVLAGHGGPGFYNDIREVEPTTSDCHKLLRLILDKIESGRGDAGQNG